MDIATWLRTLSLGQYEQTFRDNDITGELLASLTADDLRDIGVASVGHRRKLLGAIASLRSELKSKSPSPSAVLGAERRQITVVFCDLVGSTALSARLDPEDMRDLIGAYHRRCTEIVTKSGGFVAKYMGDGVLAYFGYPKAREDDAERAVRAGLALVEGVDRLPAVRTEQPRVRVGIATGLVVVGDLIGEGAAQERGVVGDTPNLAARLQALADPGTVVISAATRRLIGGLFEYRTLDPVAVKGFAEPVVMSEVLSESAVESRFEALRPGQTPLVGRTEEMDLLWRRWEQVKSGEGRIVLLSGEPGIGKSRITAAFHDSLAGENFVRMRYFCSPQHQDSALYPIISQLERAAGFVREDGADQRLVKLETLLEQSRATPGEIGFIADLLAVPTDGKYPVPDLTPQKKKERTLAALLAQVTNIAAGRPILAQYEDLHWVDPTTLELLSLSIERLATTRALVVATARPEFIPPWSGQAHFTAVHLVRLARRDGAALAEHVAGKRLPDEVVDQILERTDGVPLFIEELTKNVLESGVLREKNGVYALDAPLPALAIPATLHDSLMARLDRLSPVKEIAQIGAAIGREFSYELLATVAQMPTTVLDDALSQLAQSELIYVRGLPPYATYSFKHALVQDTAYGTLLRSQRQLLHGRIVAALEAHSDFAEIQPELVAHHCAEAGQSEKAVDRYIQAMRHSLGRSAVAEAFGQIRKGLALISGLSDSRENHERELELQIALARVAMATTGYTTTIPVEAATRARALAEGLDRSVPLLWALYTQSICPWVRGDMAESDEAIAESWQIGEARNDDDYRSCSRNWRAFLRGSRGQFRDAMSDHKDCAAFYHPSYRERMFADRNSEDLLVSRLMGSARSAMCLGLLDQARAFRDEAIAEAHRLWPFTVVAALNWTSNVLHGLQMWSTLSAANDETEKLCVEHGFYFFSLCMRGYRGWCLVAEGRAAEGIPLIAEGIEGTTGAGCLVNVPYMLGTLADAHGKAGQPEEGLKCLNECFALMEKTDDRWGEAEAHRVHAGLLSMVDRIADAEASLARAINVARHQDAKFWELLAATDLARLWQRQDKRAEARALLAPVYEWFTEGLDTPPIIAAKVLLSELRA